MPNNFLSDFQRSNSAAILSNLAERAVDIRREESRMAGERLNMAINMEDLGRRREEHQRKIALAEQQILAAENENAEYERVQTELNKQSDVTVHPAFLSLPESTRKEVLDWGAKNGYWTPGGRGTRRNQMEAMKSIEGSKELFSNFMGQVIEQKRKAAWEAWDLYKKAQESGKPEAIEKALANFERLRSDYNAASGAFDEHLNKLGGEKESKMQSAEHLMQIDGRWGWWTLNDDGSPGVFLRPATTEDVSGKKDGEGGVSWENSAMEIVKAKYGTTTINGFEVNEDSATDYQRASAFLGILKSATESPKQAGALAVSVATKISALESTYGGKNIKEMAQIMLAGGEKPEAVVEAIAKKAGVDQRFIQIALRL